MANTPESLTKMKDALNDIQRSANNIAGAAGDLFARTDLDEGELAGFQVMKRELKEHLDELVVMLEWYKTPDDPNNR